MDGLVAAEWTALYKSSPVKCVISGRESQLRTILNLAQEDRRRESRDSNRVCVE